MSTRAWFAESIGELVLVVISAGALSVVALDAFFLFSISDALGYWGRAALAAGIVALLVAVLYAIAYKRENLVAGIVVYIALVGVLVVVALSFSSGEGGRYADAEGNYLYFAFVVAGCATGCFLLSRSSLGCVVWFAVATFACSVVQAFYECEELGMSIAAGCAALALVVYRNCRQGVRQAHAATAPSRTRTLLAALVPTGLAFSLGVLLWFAVIAPLAPGVIDVKLVTEYRSLPIELLKGTADVWPTLNVDMTSDELVDGERYTTDDLVQDPDSSTTVQATSLLEQLQEQEQESEGDEESGTSGGGTTDALDEASLDEQFEGQSYTRHVKWGLVIAVLACVLVCALVGFFVGRRTLRARRLERMLCLQPGQDVCAIYRFLLARMGRLGFAVPEGATLEQWAATSARGMEVLDEVAGVRFATLTALYTDVVYGQHVPTDDETVLFVAYYLNFWKAARAQLGNVRYVFKSFRL